MEPEELGAFVNFCSGCARLPEQTAAQSAAGGGGGGGAAMPFKICAPPPGSDAEPDKYLPVATGLFGSYN